MTFSIGQRWISNTESQLGLGIIVDVNKRQVSVNFPAVGEERIYATDSATLSRITYKDGEEITTSNQQRMHITQIEEQHGVFFYSGVDDAGHDLRISELNLDCFIQLNTP